MSTATDMMGTKTGLSAASFSVDYAFAVLNKAKESQEQLSANLIDMMQQPQPQIQIPKGQYFDQYV